MLNVAGLVPFTTIDFPGEMAAVIFFKGCPLRCPFCHNPALQETGAGDKTWQETIAFLQGRKKRLDGVVLSGGEPLMQSDIVRAAQELKDMGFKVAVHTAGVYPEKLRELIPFISWVGLDIKAPWDKYELLSGRPSLTDKVKQSIAILQEAGVPFEARTTCDPRYLTVDDIDRLTDELHALGVSTYVMQKYRTFEGDSNPPSSFDIDAFFKDEKGLKTIEKKFTHFCVR